MTNKWYEFGNLVKQSRKSLKLSQGQLADKIEHITDKKLGKGTISRWEHGNRRPNKDNIEALEEALYIPHKLLFSAAHYETGIQLDEKAVINLVELELKRKAHIDQLVDIAELLLGHNLDTLTLNAPSPSQKNDPKWQEYFHHFKYKLYDGDSVSPIKQQQLKLAMKENIEAVLSRYQKSDLDCFLSHLEAEPDILTRDLFHLLEEQPFDLVGAIKMMAQRKTFKGSCSVCEDN